MISKSTSAMSLGWAMIAFFFLVQSPFLSHAGPGVADGTTELYIKVHFKASVKISVLKPGDSVDGELAEPVYSGDREVFAKGSRVRLTVDKVERKRKAPNDHWPWVIRAFARRHENHPVFSVASVFLPDGREVPIGVSLISTTDKRDVHVQWRTQKTFNSSKGTGAASAQQPSWPSKEATDPRAKPTATTATFEAVELTSAGKPGAPGVAPSAGVRLPDHARIDAGTQARVILLGEVSASRSHAGDVIAARLVEPIRVGSTVLLPQGTVFEGKVVKVTRPRILSRSGSLLLTFERVTLPDGASVPVAASIIGAELAVESHAAIDAEGNLSGGGPGRAWMLINFGASVGIAKAADDVTELVIGLIVSTATEASSAGVARIVGACVSGVFLLTRHGRDVVLPRLTEMRIVLDHPVSMPATHPQRASSPRQWFLW